MTMAWHYRFLASVCSTLVLVTGCFSEPPQRPVALDPSNPNAPESESVTAAGRSTSTAGEAAKAGQHHHGAAPPEGSAGSPSSAQPAPSENPGTGTLYTCPMHPDVTRSTPGRCPQCGMELVPRTPQGDHQDTDHGGMR